MVIVAIMTGIFSGTVNAQLKVCRDCDPTGSDRTRTARTERTENSRVTGSVWNETDEWKFGPQGSTVKTILDTLSRNHRFEYAIDPETDDSFLNKPVKTNTGSFAAQPIRDIITKTLSASGVNARPEFREAGQGPAFLMITGPARGPATSASASQTPTMTANAPAENVDVNDERMRQLENRVRQMMEQNQRDAEQAQRDALYDRGYATTPPPDSYPRITVAPPQRNPAYVRAVRIQAEIEQRHRAYEDIYGLGGPLFEATAPSRIGAPSDQNLAGIVDPNLGYMPYYGSNRRGYYGGDYGYYGDFSPVGYAAGVAIGNWIRNRDTRDKCTKNPDKPECKYGGIWIDSPYDEAFLQQFDLYCNGKLLGPASLFNSWPNQAATFPIGDYNIEIKFGQDTRFKAPITVLSKHVSPKGTPIRVDNLRVGAVPKPRKP
jgi:hypothetical protein